MRRTYAYLVIAAALYAAVFVYLFLLANQSPVCEPHAWLDITVCHTEPSYP